MNPFTAFFNPKSIAVVGASRSVHKVGYQIMKNIIDGGFKGKLYPINPNAKTILGLRCYPTLHHLPHPVDVVVIVTPAPLVPVILEECHQTKIKHAIIISAGFAEKDAKGKALQQELEHFAAHHQVRILGPNCLGCLSTWNYLNATFGPPLPQTGPLMLISQSGALVTGILDWAKSLDIGLSHAVTFGNRIDVNELEALEYAAADPHTKVILTYIESFQNAPAFFSACSKITPKKPVILLKGGQSLLGQKASASHTAALASNYTLIKAYAKQAGVIITDTLEDWLTVAAAFIHTPVAKSNQLTILTNAGGPGVLSTDEAVELGLEVPELSPSVKHILHQSIPQVNPHNPLDILGDATPETFKSALTVLKKDPSLHNLLIVITPQTPTDPTKTAQAIVDSNIYKHIPTYTVLIGGDKMDPARNILEKNHCLHFDFPTLALQVIAHKTAYETTRTSIAPLPTPARRFITAAKKAHFTDLLQRELSLQHAFDLLNTYGISLPKSAIITAKDEVGEALEYVGKPAVAKTANMHIAHKAQVDGVHLHLMTAQQTRIAYDKLMRLDDHVLIQQTIHGESELILGVRKDPQLGAFITIGFGGTMTNIINDRVYAFIPTSRNYLKQILVQTKAFQTLHHKHLPLDPILDAMERLAAIALDIPSISEIEINPAIVTKKRLYAADVKISIQNGSRACQ